MTVGDHMRSIQHQRSAHWFALAATDEIRDRVVGLDDQLGAENLG